MKGPKPKLQNVIPMKGDTKRRTPDAPDFMSDEGRGVWARLAPIMVAKDRLEPHYHDMFAAYCESTADYIRFTGEIAMAGSWYQVKTRNGLQEKKRATWTQRNEAFTSMTRISALFGMTPVDERRLSGDGQGNLLDELEAVMNGTN